jgi:hypothetical protein
MFSRPAGGAEIFDLIVDVARAGDMVIYAPGMPPCVVSEEQRSQLPEELMDSMGGPTLVANGAELLELIEHA